MIARPLSVSFRPSGSRLNSLKPSVPSSRSSDLEIVAPPMPRSPAALRMLPSSATARKWRRSFQSSRRRTSRTPCSESEAPPSTLSCIRALPFLPNVNAESATRDRRLMRCRTLDELPWSRRYSVGPALTSEIGRLVALAVPEIPAMRIIEPAIRRVHERNPDSILAVRGRKGLEGGVALLHLNRQGLAALLDGTFGPAEPRLEHLTLAHETPAAIYGW